MEIRRAYYVFARMKSLWNLPEVPNWMQILRADYIHLRESKLGQDFKGIDIVESWRSIKELKDNCQHVI
jgi:hypothetical protein